MIEAKQVSKYYEDIKALDQVSVTINEGNVFGLVGTNGAGKSTFMRILSGVLKADQGEITIDGHPVYENMEAKSQVFYISDDQYFFPSGTPADMETYYRVVYPQFDHDRFVKMMAQFDLDIKGNFEVLGSEMIRHVHLGNTLVQERTWYEEQGTKRLRKGRRVTGHIGFRQGNVPLGQYLKQLADEKYGGTITIEICQRAYFLEAHRYAKEAFDYVTECIRDIR